ncbi:hypothetical protein [Sphingomonas abaci]|uniref:Uncharacterized protein n=1 Tax=Sphingomonas abaci TaxID=237611 RepID=A0A7W7AIH1_9SPHN|nr:hypothetical protein [Sphingomonas abaci]MBB4617648.1 hypothetical protein [Sphingomonas abaci]
MGKKKKHKQKHDHRHEGTSPKSDSAKSGLPPQVAGVAAALSRHLSSPEGRHMLATGLTMAAAAASAALTRPTAQTAQTAQRPAEPPRPPEAPVPPQPEAGAPPPPPPPTPPQGTTKTPDPQVIATVIGDMADQLFTKLFASRKA